jgi:hypothetical protein
LVEPLERRVLLSAPATFVPEGVGGGGGLYKPVISPFNPQEIYVPSDMGIEYLTTNFGQSWTDLSGMDQLAPNEYIPVQFTGSPSILYASTQAWRVSKSADGGQTWNYVPGWNNTQVYQIQADKSNASNLFVTSADGNIYYSLDGGNSFSPVPGLNFAGTTPNIAGEFSDGSTIYLATSGGLAIYNGSSWSLAGAAFPTPYNSGYAMLSFTGAKSGNTIRLACVLMQGSDVDPGTTGWNANGDAGAGRPPVGPFTLDIVSGVAASSWVNTGNTTNGLGGGTGHNNAVWVQMASGDITDIYAAGFDANGMMQAYKTTSAGATWTSLMDTSGWTNVLTGPLAGYGYGNGGAAQGLSVCWTNPNYVVVSNNVGIFGSTDGGAHWSELSTDPNYLNPYGSITTRQSYYSTINEVTSWNVTFLDATRVFGGFSDVGGMYSTDGGKSWQYSSGIGNSAYFSTYDTRSGLLYASGSYQHDIWEQGGVGDFSGGGGPLLVSSDGGATFTPLVYWSYSGATVSEGAGTSLGSNDVVEGMVLDRNTPGKAYVLVDGTVDDIGGVYVTTDLQDGTNSHWTKLPDAPGEAPYEHPYSIVQLPSGNIVVSYAGFDANNAWTGAGVFLWNVSAQTWANCTANYPSLQHDIRQVYVEPEDASGNTWFICSNSANGSAAGIWKTTNGGTAWTQVWASPAGVAGAQAFVIDPATHEAFVATQGSGMYYCSNIDSSSPTFTWLSGFPHANPSSLTLNPFNPDQLWVTTFGGGMFSADLTGLAPGLPAVPTGISATVVNSAQVTVTWADTLEPSPEGYHVSYSTDTINWTLGATVNSASLASAVVSGLSPSTKYYFRVTAFGPAGETMPDDFTTLDSGGGGYHWWASVTTAATTNPAHPALPASPTGLSATVISPTEIDFTWSQLSSTQSGFHIQYSTDGTTYATLDTLLSASATSYKCTNLLPGTQYWFRITACNASGDSAASNILANLWTQIAPPAKPTNLTAAANPATGSITILWDDSTNNNDYKVYYTTNARDNFGNATWTLAASGVAAGTFSVPGLSTNVPYFFKVSANNSTAEASSDIVGGAILAAPTGPSAAAIGPTVVTCTWTNASLGADGWPLNTGFHVQYSTDQTHWTTVPVNSPNSTCAWISGLTPSTPYYFRVSAFSASGDSLCSGIVNAATMAVPANVTWEGSSAAWMAWSGLGNPPWSSAPAWNGQDNLIFNSAGGAVPYVNIDASQPVNSLTFNTSGGQIPLANLTQPAGDVITLYGNITATGPNAVYIDEAGSSFPLQIVVPAGMNPTYTVGTLFRLAGDNSFSATGASTITLAGTGQFLINRDTTTANNWILTASPSQGGELGLGGGVIDDGAITVSGASASLQLGAIYDDPGVATQAGNIIVNAGDTLTLYCAMDGDTTTTGLITGALSGSGNVTRLRPGMPDSHLVKFDSATTNTLSGNLTLQAGVNELDGTWTGLGNIALTYDSWGNPLSITGDGNIGMAPGKTVTLAGGQSTYAILAPTGAQTFGTAGNGNSVNFQNQSELELDLSDPDSLAVNGSLNLGNTGTTNVLALNFTSLVPSSTYTLATYSSLAGSQGKFGSVYINGVRLSGDGTGLHSIDAYHHLVYGPTGLQLVAEVPPAAPTGLKAIVANSTQINLSWTDNAVGETGYHVSRSTDDTTWSAPVALGANSTSYAAVGLTAGTTYYFRVTAYGPAGDSTALAGEQLAPIAGDINCDGLVDVADYNIWAANVGATGATWTQGDLNGDGLVDVADYNIWAANVGDTASASSDLTGQAALPAMVSAASTSSTPASAPTDPALPGAGVSSRLAATAADTSVFAVAAQGLIAPPAWAASSTATALADATQSEPWTALAARPSAAAAVATRATQQTPPVWPPAQRTTNLAVACGGDFDMLAHIKPRPVGDSWASTDGKPSDFSGDLLASPLDDLDQ